MLTTPTTSKQTLHMSTCTVWYVQNILVLSELAICHRLQVQVDNKAILSAFLHLESKRSEDREGRESCEPI